MIRSFIRYVACAFAYGLVAYLAILNVLRPWQRDWGSDVHERTERLPGDEHAGAPWRAGDRAIAIDAPADAVTS